jgi:hypothetical protein
MEVVSVVCAFSDKYADQLSQLSKGEEVTIQGVVKGLEPTLVNIFGAIIVENCQILTSEKQPQNSVASQQKEKNDAPIDVFERFDMFVESVANLSQSLIQKNKHTFEDIASMELDDGGKITLYNRVWKYDKFSLALGYHDNAWKDWYIINFETNDKSFEFAGEIRIGVAISKVLAFLGEELTLDEGGKSYSMLFGSQYMRGLSFGVENDKVNYINYSSSSAIDPIVTDKTAEYLGWGSAQEIETQSTENPLISFRMTIDNFSLEKIRGKKPSFEDVAEIEDEMDGDMTAYMRVWKEKNFYIVRGYEDDTWQNQSSFLARFWTSDSSMDFGSGLKVGSSFSELASFFGDLLYETSPDNKTKEYSVLGEGEAFSFIIEKDKIKSITYMVQMPFSDKMSKYLGFE